MLRTLAIYNSGRREFYTDKTPAAMAKRREALNKVPTILLVKTPTLEELTEER